MRLDLLIPDLFPPADATAEMRALRLPALEKWLAAAELARGPARGALEWLAQAHGLAEPAPVAAIALAGEGREARGTWLRADPVHLRIERDAMVLHPAATLAIEAHEAEALVATLQAHFREDGLEFASPDPERWYVRIPEGDIPATTPLADAAGRDILRLLPDSEGSVNLRMTLTEAQMLLAPHEVNARREAARRPVINSVWFWGGGPLPAALDAAYHAIHAATPFARGLARLTGVDARKARPALADIEEGAPTMLVELDMLSRALERGDSAGWNEAALALEREWFEPLARELDRFDEVRLILPGAKETLVARLRRPSLLQRFRSAQPLSAYA